MCKHVQDNPQTSVHTYNRANVQSFLHGGIGPTRQGVLRGIWDKSAHKSLPTLARTAALWHASRTGTPSWTHRCRKAKSSNSWDIVRAAWELARHPTNLGAAVSEGGSVQGRGNSRCTSTSRCYELLAKLLDFQGPLRLDILSSRTTATIPAIRTFCCVFDVSCCLCCCF